MIIRAALRARFGSRISPSVRERLVMLILDGKTLDQAWAEIRKTPLRKTPQGK